jgi:2-phosphosulfolactate phosphatase
VVAGSLRNAPAVARWVKRRQSGDVGLVAAGEQWADGALRPAYEDWVGAGAIADLLHPWAALSPEAAAAALAAQARRPLRDVASGVELVQRGYVSDIDLAEHYGADDVVPVLESGRFIAC